MLHAVHWHPPHPARAGALPPGGFDLVHINIGDSDVPLEEMVGMLATFWAWLSERPEEYLLVSRVDDVLRTKREGKLAECFDIEGAHALGKQLDLIPFFYGLGALWLLMAYEWRHAYRGTFGHVS